VSEGVELRELIEERLERLQADHPRTRPLPRRRLRALASLLTQGGDAAGLSSEARELVALLGVGGPGTEAELGRVLSPAREIGLGLADLVPIAQAYYRGVARIVEAEATALQELLRRSPPADRRALLERVLSDPVFDATERVFALLHASLLRAALIDDVSTGELQAPNPSLAIALVDLTGSTAHLEGADREATELLVDALFEAGQAVTAARAVRVVKYVGDGVFLSARRPDVLANACFEAIELLARRLPLPARAGIAYGPLLRRSGDYFGFPVNMAQRLTKVAPPCTVLASAAAAGQIDPARHRRRRRLRLPGSQKRHTAIELASIDDR
jgi:class 3 adenylate cyclase